MEANFQVRKRGGELEVWSKDKVINSIGVAGVSTKEAEAVGELVEAWAARSAENNVISSLAIRDKVIEILKVVDSVAADAFEAFKK